MKLVDITIFANLLFQTAGTIALLIVNFVLNFNNFVGAKYGFDSGYAHKLPTTSKSIVGCTKFSKESVNILDNVVRNPSFTTSTLILLQYWGSFVIIAMTLIYRAINMNNLYPKNHEIFITNITLNITRLLFASGVFIPTIIDYSKPCIQLKISAHFLSLSSYAILIALLLGIIAIILEVVISEHKHKMFHFFLLSYLFISGIFFILLLAGNLAAVLQIYALSFIILIDLIVNTLLYRSLKTLDN